MTPAQFQAEVAVGNIGSGIDLGTAKIPPSWGCRSKNQTRSSHQSKGAGIHLQWGVNEGERDVGSPDPDPLQPALTSEHSYPCPKVQGRPLLLLLGGQDGVGMLQRRHDLITIFYVSRAEKMQ